MSDFIEDLKGNLKAHFTKTGEHVDVDGLDRSFFESPMAFLRGGKLYTQNFDTIVSVVRNSQCCTYGCGE